jgi:hypothetical protein
MIVAARVRQAMRYALKRRATAQKQLLIGVKKTGQQS